MVRPSSNDRSIMNGNISGASFKKTGTGTSFNDGLDRVFSAS